MVSRSARIWWIGGPAALALVGILGWLAASYLYGWTENRNFEELRRKSELDCTRMPLHCAVRDEDSSAIADFFATGGDPELVDGWGRTALFWAVQNARLGVVGELLSRGADANARDETGSFVLYRAIAGGAYETADQLLAAGSAIDAMNGDSDLQTALHYCVMQNQSECVEFLLLRGADRSVEDSYGYTPLQRVALHDHIDAHVGELLRR